ncbi:MAG TPA: hypothetical protein VKY74_23970 [Chloroflexia bacterium]|nr:hypothetical protein [Chloroflexia bacterium]
MQLNLDAAQVSALITVLDSYYSDLREEIYHTEAYDMRQSLKELEQTLVQIREQLEPGWMARTGVGGDNPAPPTGTLP